MTRTSAKGILWKMFWSSISMRRRKVIPSAFSICGKDSKLWYTWYMGCHTWGWGVTRALKKRMASHPTRKWQIDYLEMVGFFWERIYLSVVRSNNLLIQGQNLVSIGAPYCVGGQIWGGVGMILAGIE